MEKLKEKIIEKIPADKDNVNEEFTRDVHFQIVSEAAHIKDHQFANGNRGNNSGGDSGRSMEFGNDSNVQESAR